ncbi:MAG TPA: hypothetical protein DDZ91_14455 [Firmicutes bacterium]|nr:hypothetical protein [Bacillota bacterium]
MDLSQMWLLAGLFLAFAIYLEILAPYIVRYVEKNDIRYIYKMLYCHDLDVVAANFRSDYRPGFKNLLVFYKRKYVIFDGIHPVIKEGTFTTVYGFLGWRTIMGSRPFRQKGVK